MDVNISDKSSWKKTIEVSIPYTDLVADFEKAYKEYKKKIRLEGDIPSPISPPSGCHFHPRCSHAVALCRQQYPQQSRCSETHVVHCHLLSAEKIV